MSIETLVCLSGAMDSRSNDDESNAEDGHGERGASRMDGTVSADEEEERIEFDQDEGAAAASSSSAAADPEAAAQAPPPTALSDADKEELIAKLEEMRKARSNQRFELHGWSCAWKSRPGQHTAFDMTCIEDATGAKCFSVRALPSSRAHDAAAPCENPRREVLTTRSPPPWSTPRCSQSSAVWASSPTRMYRHRRLPQAQASPPQASPHHRRQRRRPLARAAARST